MKKHYALLVVPTVVISILISIAVLNPKAVRATVATLIRDEDNPARHPFGATCDNGSSECTMTVPSGVEWVIQSAVFYYQLAGAIPTVPPAATLSTTAGGAQTLALLTPMAPVGAPVGSPFAYGVTASVTAYADPGSAITCFFNTGTTGQGQCQLQGYYVTLP